VKLVGPARFERFRRDKSDRGFAAAMNPLWILIEGRLASLSAEGAGPSSNFRSRPRRLFVDGRLADGVDRDSSFF